MINILDIIRSWIVAYGIKLIVFSFILVICWWLINKLDKIIIKFFINAHVDASVVYFLSSISKYGLRVILIAIILSNFGVNMVSIMTAIGASLVTVGIALKDSMSNIAGGVIIVLVRPFRIGDYIECGSAQGVVSKIEIMFTTLDGDDGQSIIIPNSSLIANVVKRKRVLNNYVHIKKDKN